MGLAQVVEVAKWACVIELLGYPREQFLGRMIWQMPVFRAVAANEHEFARVQQQEYVNEEDLALETAAGRRIAVELVSHVYQEDQAPVVSNAP